MAELLGIFGAGSVVMVWALPFSTFIHYSSTNDPDHSVVLNENYLIPLLPTSINMCDILAR